MISLIIVCFVLVLLNMVCIYLLHSFYCDLVNLNKSFYSERRKFNMVCFGCRKTKTGIREYISDHSYKRLAVYGIGAVFNIFKDELCNVPETEILVYIDQNDKREKIGGIEVVRLEQLDTDLNIDLVIVTVMNGYEIIKKKLEQKTDADIVNIEELLYW